MNKRLLAAFVVSAIIPLTAANAATVMVGDFTFDDSQAADTVTLVNGQIGLGDYVVGDTIPEAEGFDLLDYVELTGNGDIGSGLLFRDVLQVEFDGIFLVNGAGNCAVGDFAGCDLLVFERLTESDVPTLALSIDPLIDDPDSALHGVLLQVLILDLDGEGFADDKVSIFGFDLSALMIATGASLMGPLYISRDVGTPDLAAFVAFNFTEVPLPGAVTLFLSGLAGLGFARLRRRKP